MLFRPVGPLGGLSNNRMQPGDVLPVSMVSTTLATNGAGTITAAMIAAGLINRTTVGASFNDTLDTTWNIIQAMAGNFPALDSVQGLSFLFKYKNTVAQAMTMVVGDTGTVLAGTTTNAGSLFRDYLVTLNNVTAPFTANCNMVTTTKVVTFDSPIYQTQNLLGGAGTGGYGTVTPGMIMSGTNITAGTKVAGLLYGAQGTIVGVTTDTNTTGTSTGGTAITFLPCITVTGLGTSGL